MKTKRTTRKERSELTISVEQPVHRALRDVAAERGMKLKLVPSLLVELWSLRTPEQEQAAEERFRLRRIQSHEPVGAA